MSKKKEKKQKPKVWFDEETNIKKYEKLEEYLTKMKLTEVDDDDPDLLNSVHGKPFSKNVGIPTKTIHVLNYLMDEKIREVIEKMKKLEINCLNKNTKETIQKQILNIKNEERVKDAEKAKEKENKRLKEEENKRLKEEENKKLKEEENKILKEEENKILKEEENKILKEENNKILQEEENKKVKEEKTKVDNLKKKNIMKLKNQKIGKHSRYQIILNPNLGSNNSRANSKRYSSIFSEKSKDEISVRSNIQTSFNNFTKNVFLKTSINCSKGNKTFHKEKNEKEIQKISCDHYIFNKSFKEKKKYLDEQFNRELKFQKNLLKSKGSGSEDFDFISFDERKTKAQCEDFFEKALENEIKLGIEKDIKKEEQKKLSQMERLSLNAFRFPIKLLGKLSKKPKKEFKPEVENRKYIDQLTSQIEVIDNTKKYILKSYKRNLKKNI
jgi:hypothetical protein